MADSVIEDEIQTALRESPTGRIVVATHGEFRYQASVNGSSKEVKRALGSLIQRGAVVRSREPMQGCTDVERPITFRLHPQYY